MDCTEHQANIQFFTSEKLVTEMLEIFWIMYDEQCPGSRCIVEWEQCERCRRLCAL